MTDSRGEFRQMSMPRDVGPFPASVRQRVEDAWLALQSKLGGRCTLAPEIEASLPMVWASSPFVVQCCLRDPGERTPPCVEPRSVSRVGQGIAFRLQRRYDTRVGTSPFSAATDDAVGLAGYRGLGRYRLNLA